MKASNQEVRRILRGISDQYADGLRAESRRRVIGASLETLRSQRVRPTWSYLPRLAAAAAILALLAFPSLRLGRVVPEGPRTPITDLQVTTEGGMVVLTWDDGNEPRRIVRATSREQLSHLDQAPSEIVLGQRWVDTQPERGSLVYYFVE